MIRVHAIAESTMNQFNRWTLCGKVHVPFVREAELLHHPAPCLQCLAYARMLEAARGAAGSPGPERLAERLNVASRAFGDAMGAFGLPPERKAAKFAVAADALRAALDYVLEVTQAEKAKQCG